MIDHKVKRQLEAIDWDFPSNQTGVTKLAHWYPGTFPSQLPASLIQAITLPGDLVFDPYGGAGTTAAEAIRLGRKAWAVDLNPIGVLSNYVYCALLILKKHDEKRLNILLSFVENLFNPSNKLDDLYDFEHSLIDFDEFISSRMRPSPKDLLKLIRVADEPREDLLLKWFDQKTLTKIIEFYRDKILVESNVFLRVFVEFMISANMRALCSQNKSWGHIADNVYPKELIEKDIFSQLRKWLNLVRRNISSVKFEGEYKTDGIQYWADVYDWNSNKEPTYLPSILSKALITSPPYADAIDYIFSQKLSLYYFGYDDRKISELCSKEIGARRKRFKSDSRSAWANDLGETAKRQSKYIKDGFFVAIMPHKNHGREIGLNTMTDFLVGVGWSVVFEVDRSINQKKTRQSWTSIKMETIRVFKKGG